MNHIEKVGCLQEEQTHRIFTHMVRAVNYCQENSVARRDIKPDNVLLDGKGSVRLCDFSLTIKVTCGQVFKGCGMVCCVVGPDIQCVTEMGHPAGSDHCTVLAGAVRWCEQQGLVPRNVCVLCLHPHVNSQHTMLV